MRRRTGFLTRTAVLALLAVAAVAYHLTASWQVLHAVVLERPRIEQPIQTVPGTTKVANPHPSAVQAGIAPGDEIVAVNGEIYDGSNDLRRAVERLTPGSNLRIRWRRDGVERESAISPSYLARPTVTGKTAAKLVAVVVSFLTPMFCLVVGFGVALIRPHDYKAWIVLLLMWSFTNLAGVANSIVTRVPNWLVPLVVVYPPIAAALWGTGMLLFSFYFPSRLPFDKKYPWVKWLILTPMLVNTVNLALLMYREMENTFAYPWLPSTYSSAWSVQFWLNAVAVGVCFSTLGWRSGTEKNADARRRLRLIWAGMATSLAPTFLIVVVAQLTGRDAFRDFPVWVVLPALALLFLFPATLFYVIVVERAMDLRVVVRQGVQYALAQRGVLLGQLILGALVVYLTLSALSDPTVNRPGRFLAVFAAILLIALGRRLARWLRASIDRRFFREAVSAERVLTTLGDSVRSIADTPTLIQRVCDVIRDTLHVSRVELSLIDGDGLQLAYANGAGQAGELTLPLRAQDRVVGLMSLGPKRSEEPYSRSDVRLLENVAGQTGLAIDNGQLTAAMAKEIALRERVNREMEIAREVQERLFPHYLPPVAGVEYAGHCRPVLSIGGDYYDFFAIDSGLALAIGDVSGKGVGSALLMASLQGGLRVEAAAGRRDLAQMMSDLNRLIFDLTPPSKYATLVYAQYDAPNRRLTYVNAGHNAPFVLRGSEVIRLEAGGPVVGLLRQATYSQEILEMQPGDVFVGFTDGISEAMNRDDDEWGEDQIIETVRGVCDGMPQNMIAKIMEGADRFAAGAQQSDDMTVIVLKIV